MLNRKKGTADEATLTVRQRLKQMRELEEKRKFGLAPLCVDAVSGQEISPNVPNLISQAPWYYGCAGPTLAHQRKQSNESIDTLQDKRDTVSVLGKAKTYMAGACGNCGSNSHKTSECYKPRKRVGAMYTGKVTGVDMTVSSTDKNYAQKRDRYAMGVDVDFLKQVKEEGDVAEVEEQNDKESAEEEKRRRLHDVFTLKTAVSGGGMGVAIKELPKHLHNLDDNDIFFDPKTGSMRGNPNAMDPTRTFQGDLQRYRSGDYYTYLEMQLRFLNGESTSFVDFKLDEQLQKQKQQEFSKDNGELCSSSGNGSAGKEEEKETARDQLIRSLYGDLKPASSGNSLRIKEALALAATSPATPTSLGAGPAPTTEGCQKIGPATRNGHPCVYGSYFDPQEFKWGYKCCQRLGKNAESCKPEGAVDTVVTL
uniref:Pre-mRNA-splicing factor SLU7 n=1 Tax=Trypanosoma congolense (strain IL3000) TaxID=1068625 RepID=G0ULU4_TRYCI|nr:conserved hypothetical protein [Trypanosoma congolense IL3000]